MDKAYGILAMEMAVTLAITNHVLNCGISAVETWALAWLDGTDRTEESALESRVTAAYWGLTSATDAAADAAGLAVDAEAERELMLGMPGADTEGGE